MKYEDRSAFGQGWFDWEMTGENKNSYAAGTLKSDQYEQGQKQCRIAQEHKLKERKAQKK